VDLREIPGVKIGDAVELWGEAIPVEEVAEHAGTIAYELISGIQSRLNVIINDED
jgi:alanine racemase